MRKIENCTLFIADTFYYGGAVAALRKSLEQCVFDEVVFCTNIPLTLEGIKVVKINELKGKDGYSNFIIKEAYKYIKTDFALISQHDGWVLDAEQFDERLYNVDYCGALWLETDGLSNGNGGFSWRSQRLMEAAAKDDLINATSPEDVCLCRVYRRYLEKNYNLIWADDDTCEKFSFELRCPVQPTFGFHNFFHIPYQKTVVIIRHAALGDVVQVEPVLKYFFDKGYRVVLDTLDHFLLLFLNHYFKVHTLKETDQRLLDVAKVVNLNMSYESNPKQLHLKTYFEYAGVGEDEYLPYLKNPRLSVGFDVTHNSKLFKKYCILHIDKREQPHRNIENIDWYGIVRLLNKMGFTVIQLGRGEHIKVINAIELNCTNENFLCYVCAGADLMIGIDSGISNICSGFNVPSIVFFGSVNPEYIHPNLDRIIAINNHKGKGVCDTPYCWHNQITTSGIDCYVDKEIPPCTQFKTSEVINAINKLCN